MRVKRKRARTIKDARSYAGSYTTGAAVAELSGEVLANVKGLAMKYAKMGYFRFQDVEDVVQDCFLAMLQGINHFDQNSDCGFETYAAYWFRKRFLNFRASWDDKGTAVSFDEPAGNREEGLSYSEVMASDEVSVLARIEENERIASIRKAVLELRPRHQQLIKHVYFEGMSYEQAGVPLGEVKPISRQRVGQLHKEMTNALRQKLADAA